MNTRQALLRLSAPLLAVGLACAACGSGGSDSGGSAAQVTIATRSGGGSTYLTDGSGRAVYLWVAEHDGKPLCSGACASLWEPVTTDKEPKVAGQAVASDLETVKRSDGSVQVAYDNHPLYYYAGDSGPDTTAGQGNDGFGALWWLVGPSGSAITTSVGGSDSGSNGGGGGGYGAGY